MYPGIDLSECQCCAVLISKVHLYAGTHVAVMSYMSALNGLVSGEKIGLLGAHCLKLTRHKEAHSRILLITVSVTMSKIHNSSGRIPLN